MGSQIYKMTPTCQYKLNSVLYVEMIFVIKVVIQNMHYRSVDYNEMHTRINRLESISPTM